MCVMYVVLWKKRVMRRERKERGGTGMGPLGAKTLQQISDKNQRPKETEEFSPRTLRVRTKSLFISSVFMKAEFLTGCL